MQRNPKKKILHVLVEGEYSGAQNVVINIINELKEEYEFYYSSVHGAVEPVLMENDIRFIPYAKPTYKEFKKVISTIKPDIIHAHDFTASILSSLTSGSIPVISHLHNNSPWIKKFCLKSIVYGMSCIKYKVILTVSDSVMDEFIFGFLNRKKTRVIGNPINIAVIREKAEEKLPIQTVEKITSDIVFLGRLTPQKNIFFLLEILRDLQRKKANLKVSVVGDGELRNEFEERVKTYGLQDSITMFGFQKNPYPYLKAAKIMCMPSAWEGFGLAAVEAMALGKPVVAAPVGGLKDIVDEESGFLCDGKEDYVEKLNLLLTDQKALDVKSQGAFRRADELGNMFEYGQVIKNIYNIM